MSKKNILLIITIMIVAAIFGHSMMNADISSEESGSLIDLLSAIGSFLHIPTITDDHLIRKLAHFSEFAVYGFFMTWTVRERSGSIKDNLFKILFLIMLIPLCDETIQLFIPGRSGEVKDILIDIGGALTGFTLRTIPIKKIPKNT